MFTLNQHFAFKGPEYSTTQSTTDLPRHRWYVIKEGFSPKLVEAAIDSYGLKKDDVLVDPFCGSGTVPLTATNKGMKAIGVEVNPFLAFVSATKLQNCKTDNLKMATNRIVSEMQSRRAAKSPLEGFSTFSESATREKWLFNRDVLRTFQKGWRKCGDMSSPERKLLKLALIKAAMDTCNAKTDGKCLRYKKDWKEQRYGSEDLIAAFRNHIDTIRADIEASRIKHTGTEILNSDSRSQLTKLQNRDFRLCVTSPPYLNSFDYSDVYRPELFLSNCVASNNELRRIRLRTVRSHVQASWKLPSESDFGAIYSNTIKNVEAVKEVLWDKRIPLMIQAYFEDMQTVLTRLKTAVAREAFAWIVVSTSAYGGVEIPVDFILAEIAERAGWFLREMGVVRHVRHSGHHWNRISEDQRKSAWLRETVVVLATTPKSS